ncbi:STAS domain-containing protein [Sulfuriroseicoccus oceanibius]|uniref:STAS domain-containing protein n=1 Tax=Sulfuriroseicoccus oceanibius TaxID=2707525 RepID=A0A6B3L4B8_9BACT|nr:STAS domain-containing protein [Sulfuriroseicoccus oceanibius]QQL45086.1 STAS domain-containing protein [Sulfuriroseicoccus oceanibius]
MKNVSPILVAELPPYLWVRVAGKGTFQNAADLKQFASQTIESGRTQFVIDLGECPMMDSTFMGTLTGIALKLREKGDAAKMTVVNANERNAQLLENLGLTMIFDVERGCGKFSAEMGQVDELLAATERQESTSSDVLEAHETLSGISDENRAKFKDVVEFLRAENGGDA